MKTTTKILLLILAVIAAVAAVMVFARTQSQPPEAVKQVNQYDADIKSECDAFSSLNAADADAKFATLADRVEVFSNMEKISTNEYNGDIDALLQGYVPRFTQRCFNTFRESQWQSSDHKAILDIIAQVKALHYSNNIMAVSGIQLEEINEIAGTIDLYYKACNHIKKTGFSSIDNARNTIATANQYANHQWLQYCTSLRSQLLGMKAKIAESHYRFVSNQVAELSNYHYYDYDYFSDQLVPQVNAAIKEYEQQAVSLYGSRNNMDDLWERARNYYSLAMNYYD